MNDNIELIEMGEEEGDESVVKDAEDQLKALKTEAARRQVEAMLSGEADSNDTYIEVHSGAGGTESQDWANMLLRMYTAGPKRSASRWKCWKCMTVKKPASSPRPSWSRATMPMAG